MKRSAKGLVMGLLGMSLLLAGCGSNRWSPTDPRLDTPNPEDRIVLDTWEMTIDTRVDTAAN